MIKERFILKFEGPFGLCKDSVYPLLNQTVANEQGVYIFTIPYRLGGYLVSYVGETGVSFGKRIKDHVIQTIGGNYRICDPDYLLRGEEIVLWNGLWRQGTRDKVMEYLEQFEELAPSIHKLFRIKVIFVAPLKTDKRIRRRLEGAIAIHIKSMPKPVSSLLPADIRYHVRKKCEEPISVAIISDCQLHGIPRNIEI